MSVREVASSDRARVFLAVGLGVLLVFNPVYLGPLNLGGEQYTYTAVEVTPADDGIQYESRLPQQIERVNDVECFFENPPPVACRAQATLVDGGNHTTVLTDASSGDFYGYVYLNDTFYRRYYSGEPREDRSTRVTVRYEPASPRAVLDDVSVGLDYFRERHRGVVDRGRLRTDDPFRYEPLLGPGTYRPTGQFVEANGEYYLVGLHEYEPPLRYRGLYSVSGVVVGVLALWYGARLSGATPRE